MHDRLIHIGIVNDRPVYAYDSSVIREVTTAPFAAGKADAHISEPVVNTTVVADVRAPITCVEEIVSAFKSPVGRGPQKARLGSRYPGARNPVIAVVTISPIARRPKISIFRARRLLIHRQYRRSDADADDYPGKRRCRDEAEQKRKQKQTRCAKYFHGNPPILT